MAANHRRVPRRTGCGIVSELSPFQRRVAEVLFDLPEADGFALAGGAALILRRVITRETADLDAFIAARPGPNPGTVDALANAFADSALGFGWMVENARRNPTFCRYFVTSGEERTEVDLAVDSPPLEPPETADGLPVLTSRALARRLAVGGATVGAAAVATPRISIRFYEIQKAAWS